MFARRKRQEAQAIEAIREHLAAADAHSREVLAAAIARMELRLSRDLEQRERLQVSTETAIDTLRHSVTTGAGDVARSLAQVANMCATVAEQIETDRLERRALTEAIQLLARPPSPALEAGPRVIGGTVFASPEISHDDEISIVDDEEDRVDPAPRNGASDDMWCRDDDDQWVGGVEIADISNDDDTIRYWIRRRSDGYIFPRAFDAKELRFLPDASAAANGEPQGHWSQT
jgi:hypothetical protein